MDERMTTAQEAAIGFSQRLRPEDLAEIVDFDSRVDILQDFTNDAEQLERAIQRTSAGGSTSLYNAMYIALRDLAKAPLLEADVRREAIVVLSDGEDTSSLVTFEEVLEQAKRSETAIYSIVRDVDSVRRISFYVNLRKKPVDARFSRKRLTNLQLSINRFQMNSRVNIHSDIYQQTRHETDNGDVS